MYRQTSRHGIEDKRKRKRKKKKKKKKKKKEKETSSSKEIERILRLFPSVTVTTERRLKKERKTDRKKFSQTPACGGLFLLTPKQRT